MFMVFVCVCLQTYTLKEKMYLKMINNKTIHK